MDINDLNDEQPIEAAAAKRKVGRPKGSTNGSGKKKKSTKKTKSAKKASANQENKRQRKRDNTGSLRITIRDIAEKAGVSVGTVDRVLHNRPNVSPKALVKVQKAIEEMNYEPNMYASALAHNKEYNFYCLMPKHESEAYWEEVEEGQLHACEMRRDFNVHAHMYYYKRKDEQSFKECYEAILEANPDGVVVVPAKLEVTRKFTDQLHERSIPFIMLDSYMPDLRPLAFYGQDSFASGYFAAKLLMMIASKEKSIMLMKQTIDGVHVASKQQDNREVGFRHYMKDHFPEIKSILWRLTFHTSLHARNIHRF